MVGCVHGTGASEWGTLTPTGLQVKQHTVGVATGPNGDGKSVYLKQTGASRDGRVRRLCG